MSDYSRFVLHRPHRWHVQEAGQGDLLLLIHGAGGATQSWRGLFPILARTHRIVAVDLPGQGFTQLGARQRCGLDHMAEDLLSLARYEGWKPRAIIGHSAGSAIALRMAELGAVPGGQIVGINAALANFRGVAGWLFPMLAKTLALSPFTAGLFAAATTETTVRNLIKGTGSNIDAAGIGFYLRLASDRDHVDGTLAMMAQWRLDGLLRRLPSIRNRTTLIVTDGDLAVPPATSAEAAKLLPNAQVIHIPRSGHLVHEEDAQGVADLILAELG